MEQKYSSIKPLNKKGQVIELVGGTVMGIMGLIFLIFAVLFAISALNPASFFTGNPTAGNATQSLTNNLTNGIASFGGYIPTIFLVLGVVMVLAGILVLILYVKRMQSGGMGSGVSL